jgi:hypothetical protein
MNTTTPSATQQIADLRRQWEMVQQSLPRDERTLELFLESLPESARQEMRGRYKEMVATKNQIEARLKALESVETPQEEDAACERWQHLLMKVMLFGWPTADDFVRLEGRTAETWPATQAHHSVAEWLPFTNWCEEHWIRAGRVSSILGLDVRPETAARISPPLRMALISSSQHHLNLTGFLGYSHGGSHPEGRRLSPAAILGETGHQITMEITPGSVQAVLLGRSAWRKWHTMEPIMKEWMFSELASKTLYLGIECGEDPGSYELSGWVPDEAGPDKGAWRVWKTKTPVPGLLTGIFRDVRTCGIMANGTEFDRKAILTDRLLTIFHGNATTMLRERESWKSVSGLHPMIPTLAEGGGDLYFQLHLPGEGARWMPIGRKESSTTAGELTGLFTLLHDHQLLPPELGVGDFISSTSGTYLSRIGFEGYQTHRDPLARLLETMAAWHLREIPLGCAFDPDHPLPASGFPAPFREMALQALSSMSFRDLISKGSA